MTSLDRDVPSRLGVMRNATVHHRFGEFIADAGGVPVFADHHADPLALAERVDAVVINGGGDVAPERYGAAAHARTCDVEDERDEFEIELVRAAAGYGMPVLGICRGIQLVNVALGGTLVQHVPDAVGREHMRRDVWDRPVHDVILHAGSLLSELYRSDRLGVNTLHHQAVDRPAPGLHISARAPDGTIEGVEAPEGAIIGIQWHPELMARPAADEHAVLFRWLLDPSAAASPQGE